MMQLKAINHSGKPIAVVESASPVIHTPQEALDLLASVRYETGAERVAICKQALCDSFFILSSGVAGEILQKFTNYRMKAAIYGDYSQYTSEPLRDFIYESNKGGQFFFVPNLEEALEKLSGV